VTLDQAIIHLEGIQNERIAHAASFRRRAEEYQRAANAANDMSLRQVQFRESSELLALAREYDRDAEAFGLVLSVSKEKVL
jgi:hypothetical protein